MQNTLKQVDKTTLKLNGIAYKGYSLGELPPSFGFIYNENKESHGIQNWFNYKGLTYVAK
jgi:hypothetical protein